MDHPFVKLAEDYRACLATMRVTRPGAVDAAARKILLPHNIRRYQAAVAQTSVPAAFVGVLDLRESDCNPNLGLGQGDPWDEKSRHVPRGLGPWESWVAAARFYVRYDHLDTRKEPWTLEWGCYEGELWNGLGPRAHGRHTGYLWSGTSIYDPPTGLGGKYVEDSVWSSRTVDQQMGIVPIMIRIFELRPDLAFDAAPSPETPAEDEPPAPPEPSPPPVGVGEGVLSTREIQVMVSAVTQIPLRADGSYGRGTRGVVREYQRRCGLVQDGLCGPVTEAALRRDWSALPEARRASSQKAGGVTIT